MRNVVVFIQFPLASWKLWSVALGIGFNLILICFYENENQISENLRYIISWICVLVWVYKDDIQVANIMTPVSYSHNTS